MGGTLKEMVDFMENPMKEWMIAGDPQCESLMTPPNILVWINETKAIWKLLADPCKDWRFFRSKENHRNQIKLYQTEIQMHENSDPDVDVCGCPWMFTR